MVFVPVGEYDGGQVVAILLEEIEVRDRDIDTKRRLFGKTHAGIDHDHFVAVPDAHAIHSKFADAAQRYYFKFVHRHLIKTRSRSILKYSMRKIEDRTFAAVPP